jgi:acetolactate synthase-1/2/3 large subunit
VAQTLAAVDVATRPEHPGPALVVLAIDQATKTVADAAITAPIRAETCRAPREAVVQTAAWLSEATRPLVVLGAGARAHTRAMTALVEALGVPFVTTPSGKGALAETHPLSLRHGGMAASMWARRYTAEPIDAVLVLGTDLDDTSMGPTPYLGKGGRLVHVDRNAAVFNRNLRAALAVTADIGLFAEDLAQAAAGLGLSSPHGRSLASAIRSTSAFDEPDAATDPRAPIAPHRAVLDLERAAGPRARFITDIGEHMLFALHYLTVREPNAFHIQLALGSMGSGIAGAVGLALADPTRTVVCICGDGCMQMAGSEILLALKERLPIVFCVFNDGRYNMVHHGMKQIFGAADPWDMPEVDFADLARSMGVTSAVVSAPGDIDAPRLATLLARGGPVVLDVRIDPGIRVRGGGRVEALQHMSMLRASGEPDGVA